MSPERAYCRATWRAKTLFDRRLSMSKPRGRWLPTAFRYGTLSTVSRFHRLAFTGKGLPPMTVPSKVGGARDPCAARGWQPPWTGAREATSWNRQTNHEAKVFGPSTPFTSRIYVRPTTVLARAAPHHLTFTQPRALGRRVSDEFTVPVCRGHHRELHRSCDEAAWWRRLNIDPVPVALRLWAAHTGRTLPKKGRR